MVKKLLERAIEIEGLLRIIRDGNPLPETYTLLSNKAVELAEDAMLLEEQFASVSPSGEADKSQGSRVKGQESREKGQGTRDKGEEATGNRQETDAPAEVSVIVMTDAPTEKDRKEEQNHAAKPAIVMTEDKPTKPQESTKDGKHDELAEAEDEEIDIIKDILSAVSESNTIKSSSAYEEDEDDILLTIGDEEDLSSDFKTEPQKKEEVPIISTEKKETKDKKPEIRLKKEEATKPALKRQTKLKSAFSLNDRFLYARELFEGNMKMFDSTLDFIEGIEEYSIIEDYFYGELEWDPENVSVASFMEILRPHFRE